MAVPPGLADARRIARERFGIRALHPEQERALGAVLEGRDTLVVLPTGFGKSLVYQVAAMLLDRPVLTISPLIALMRDQERSLRAHGVPVLRLDSTLRVATRRQSLARLGKGGRLIVLTTPETLESREVRPIIAEARPALLCVDEAHCISEWGHDFRPAYLRLGAERRSLGIENALALTATATPRVQEDIVERLALRDPVVVRAPPHRPNLLLSVEIAPGSLKLERTGHLIRRLPRPGILYCATTKMVDEIYAALTRARIGAVRYHGKMSADERRSAQRRYMKEGKRIVMVATSAFGMGIDKADIRYIVHVQAPGSPEQYVQEAGRAGRDGKPARCVLLFDPEDLDIQEYLQKQGQPHAGQLRRLGRALAAWAADGKAVATAELALSAQVSKTICRSLCAELEALGVLELDEERAWKVVVPVDALKARVSDLAGRFETKRRADARRLAAVDAYARTEGCRSVFLRRWFGEAEPPRCGRCDRDVAEAALGEVVRKAVARAEARAEGEPAPAERQPRRRRRRRRR